MNGIARAKSLSLQFGAKGDKMAFSIELKWFLKPEMWYSTGPGTTPLIRRHFTGSVWGRTDHVNKLFALPLVFQDVFQPFCL